MTGVPEADPESGAAIINLSWAGTGLFVATAALATIDPDGLSGPGIAVDLGLFAIGCAVFLWAYAVAVSRSRTDAIGIGGLYFLQGSAPKVVQYRLLIPLAVQVVVAVATSIIRPYTAVAFGILVPIFGLGLAGLWGARNGTFEPR
ncbi:MAG: hypothetical protein QOH64_274 [Acidimicrobiaceae bacterium]